MELKELDNYLCGKTGSQKGTPFGEEAWVYKVVKIFAILAWQAEPLRISLKCDPEYATVLRNLYSSVIPGYHLNKKHWNTVILDGSIPDDEIIEMIDHSYDLIFGSLTKRQREELVEEK